MAPGLEWPRAAHRLVYTSSNRVKKAELLRHQNSPCSCCVPREIACVQFACVCLVIAAGEGSPGLVRHPRAGGMQRSECAVYKQGSVTVGEPGSAAAAAWSPAAGGRRGREREGGTT